MAQDDPYKENAMTAPLSPEGFANAPSLTVLNAMANASMQLGYDIVDISGFLEDVDAAAQRQLHRLQLANEAAGARWARSATRCWGAQTILTPQCRA